MQPCFCQNGILSQCTAADYGEEQSCEFFSKSAIAPRCMNRNESQSNHCWSPEAQRVGLREEEIDLITDRIDIDDLLVDVDWKSPLKAVSCLECIRNECAFVRKEHSDAAQSGGLTLGDLQEIASNCVFFEPKGGS